MTEQTPSEQQDIEALLRRSRSEQEAHRAPVHLAAKIQASLPQQHDLLPLWSWLTDSAWRGMATAALPLLLGLSIGLNTAETQLIDDGDEFSIVYLGDISELDGLQEET